MRARKYWGDDQRAAFKNWEEVADPRNPLGGRQGVDERVMLRELLRRTDMMVILENKLDALVRLHTPWPPGLIGHVAPRKGRDQPNSGEPVSALYVRSLDGADTSGPPVVSVCGRWTGALPERGRSRGDQGGASS